MKVSGMFCDDEKNKSLHDVCEFMLQNFVIVTV